MAGSKPASTCTIEGHRADDARGRPRGGGDPSLPDRLGLEGLGRAALVLRSRSVARSASRRASTAAVAAVSCLSARSDRVEIGLAHLVVGDRPSSRANSCSAAAARARAAAAICRSRPTSALTGLDPGELGAGPTGQPCDALAAVGRGADGALEAELLLGIPLLCGGPRGDRGGERGGELTDLALHPAGLGPQPRGGGAHRLGSRLGGRGALVVLEQADPLGGEGCGRPESLGYLGEGEPPFAGRGEGRAGLLGGGLELTRALQRGGEGQLDVGAAGDQRRLVGDLLLEGWSGAGRGRRRAGGAGRRGRRPG